MSASEGQRGGVAFLLAQLGHHAAERFSERIAALDLTPPHAGILRVIAAAPGRSQQALSSQLQLLPSRVVTFVDDLETRGYVERRANPDDRRQYALYLTPAGKEVMGRLSRLARQHDRAITRGLSESQRAQLRELLTTLATEQGLAPDVHPGYRQLGGR
ncbi:MAG: winged helix-turn-helix transcriptional regulator [Mycobacteriaceae bacterium]|nr:winged helix-turn-helix transcriptional regulator [Mycobacteriaceae bacterium]